MKKLLTSAILLCSMLFLTACGKEQSATYRLVTEESGITMTDTMTFNAKGDIIKSMTETYEIDCTSLSEEEYAFAEENYNQLSSMYEGIDGVTCTVESANQVFKITVNTDTTGDAVDKLAELGLMEIEGESNKLSLKATIEGLEQNGYEKVE